MIAVQIGWVGKIGNNTFYQEHRQMKHYMLVINQSTKNMFPNQLACELWYTPEYFYQYMFMVNKGHSDLVLSFDTQFVYKIYSHDFYPV